MITNKMINPTGQNHKLNPEEMLPKVEKMLYALAWKFTNQYPVTFEEAKTEAYFGFMKSCNWNCDGDHGATFSSWCYFTTWNHLKTWVMKRSGEKIDFTDINEEMVGEAPPERSIALESIDDLSSDAKEIISLLLETPGELLGGCPSTARQLLIKVKNYLVAKGREKKAVEAATKEIKLRLRAVWAN